MRSILSVFKIGVGPSSSHTVGPMKAAYRFVQTLCERDLLEQVDRVRAWLHGSLSLTGKGHLSDQAVLLGLAGNLPENVDILEIPQFLARLRRTNTLRLAGQKEVAFHEADDLVFVDEPLPKHENGLIFSAYSGEAVLFTEKYYSIGGGFIVDDANFGSGVDDDGVVPYPFASAGELLVACEETGYSLSTLVLENERVLHDPETVRKHFSTVWEVMCASMERGIRTEGFLPG